MTSHTQQALQANVQRLLDQAVADGEEIGCQVAVFVAGELVVDASAGVTDSGGSTPVDSRTLFPIFSAGKGVVTTAFLRLVERGLVGLDQRVGEIWPEYACNGKEETTVRHILQHRSGVCIRTPYDTIGQIAEWDVMCARVAAAKPVFPPGSATRYQTINYSWLLGELAQRITGKPLPLILEEEVYGPAGLRDLFFGVPDRELPRVARLPRGPGLPPVPENPPCWDYSLEEIMNNRVIRQACLPGFNCISTAVDLARHYSLLLDSETRNRLLRRETVRAACAMTLAPDDAPPSSPAAWCTHGLGYVVSHPDADGIGQRFGHGGYGGANGQAFQRERLAYAYTRNLMHGTASMSVALEKLFASVVRG
ncbi:MAG: beta-lactamase family protein [Lentisphaerae bacterium]|jgi:CubicO group peptidase (beta-lactamase class C family)|nr:beta-lactamase family protein [Lentisphaerota bacterium]